VLFRSELELFAVALQELPKRLRLAMQRLLDVEVAGERPRAVELPELDQRANVERAPLHVLGAAGELLDPRELARCQCAARGEPLFVAAGAGPPLAHDVAAAGARRPAEPERFEIAKHPGGPLMAGAFGRRQRLVVAAELGQHPHAQVLQVAR
jgi:hypothetical protein